MLFSEMFSFKTIKMSLGNLKGDVLCHDRRCSLWKVFFAKLQVSWAVNVKENHHHCCNQPGPSFQAKKLALV